METSNPKKYQNGNCSFCEKKATKYTCPKCNLNYCSVECYKDPQHSKCSEEFYHDWVVSHMKHSESNESKAKMLDILKRRKEELDSDDDDDVVDIEERLDGIDLDNERLVWSNLTEKEKDEFNHFLNQEDISDVLVEWKPWWFFEEKLIEEISIVKDKNSLPPILLDIPPLTDLLKAKPSPILKYSVLNCLYGYVYIVKFYNGDYEKYSLESILNLQKISKCLEAKGPTWDNLDSSITSAIEKIQQVPDLNNSRTFLVEILLDLNHIIENCQSSKNCNSVLRALSDIQNQVENAKTELKITKSKGQKVIKTNLVMIERKILFYLSWVQDCGKKELEPLLFDLNLIYEEKLSDLKSFDGLKENVSNALSKIQPTKARQPVMEYT